MAFLEDPVLQPIHHRVVVEVDPVRSVRLLVLNPLRSQRRLHDSVLRVLDRSAVSLRLRMAIRLITPGHVMEFPEDHVLRATPRQVEVVDEEDEAEADRRCRPVVP